MTRRRQLVRREVRVDQPVNPGWWLILVYTWRQIARDNLSTLAAAAAFYALLTIFPALTALVSLYGLVADPNMVERQIAAMEGPLPAEAVSLLATWLQALAHGPTAKFGAGLVISVLLAAWSAWSATAMLMTAVNVCYGGEEPRGFVWFYAEAFALSFGLALFGATALALVAVLPVVLDLLSPSAAVHALISLARWPFLAVLAMFALAIIYRYGPARVAREWEWVSWGAALATTLWLAGSVGFAFYVSAVGSYDRTYGSLGAVVVLLLWFYMSAYVILIGAELNAQVERLPMRRRE
jgi:membrane protein